MTETEEPTGGELVVRTLRALGVRHVFGIVSVHNLPIFHAIAGAEGIEAVDVRHEQAAVHAADAYARTTGRLGVALTSTGPGAANAMGGLFEAGFASSPVLMITGQVESRFYGQGRGFLHEAERQPAMLRDLTRETITVGRTADIPDAVARAARMARTGRPQPCAVEIPIDLQYAREEAPPVRADGPPPARVDAARVSRIAARLAAAARPLIWAGGGTLSSGAAADVVALAERLDAPVVTTTNGRGAIPEDHPLSLGSLLTAGPVREIIESADYVLAVGTRFQMQPTGGWTLKPGARLAHVDADPSMIGRSYPVDIGLVADAAAALRAITADLPEGTAGDTEWAAQARKAADQAREQALDRIGPDHRAICAAIRAHLPRDGVVVRDATVPAYTWGDNLLPILTPRTSLRPTSAAIGPGLPLAVGAAVGTGRRTVVIQGDGGLMLSVGELATAAQYHLPITVCVFNDRGYGVLRGIQRATYDGEPHDVDLATPDFAALAASVGVRGVRVGGVEEFTTAFAESVAAEGPTVLDIDLTKLAPIKRLGGTQTPERDPGMRG